MSAESVLLLADTYAPRRRRELPGPLWAAVAAADGVLRNVVLHRLPPRSG